MKLHDQTSFRHLGHSFGDAGAAIDRLVSVESNAPRLGTDQFVLHREVAALAESLRSQVATVNESWPTPGTATDSIRHPSELRRPSRVVARWEGTVVDVTDQIFVGQMTPVGQAGPEVLADFSIGEVPDDDIPLLKPGAFFRVAVGLEPGRRHRKISTVSVRRMARWSDEELAEARDQTLSLWEQLGLDESEADGSGA